jgi:hypothetical protein
MNRYKTNKVIVFSQWSRKNYAIFASLGKLIKIGRVSADISQLALQKSPSGPILFADIQPSYKSIPLDTDRLRRWWECIQITGNQLQILIYLFLITTGTTCKAEYLPEGIYHLLTSMFCNTQGMDFLFIPYGNNH